MKQVMVKCRYCGKSIKNTEAFDPHTRKTPLYYCNEEEYEREQQEKKDKKRGLIFIFSEYNNNPVVNVHHG